MRVYCRATFRTSSFKATHGRAQRETGKDTTVWKTGKNKWRVSEWLKAASGRERPHEARGRVYLDLDHRTTSSCVLKARATLSRNRQPLKLTHHRWIRSLYTVSRVVGIGTLIGRLHDVVQAYSVL